MEKIVLNLEKATEISKELRLDIWKKKQWSEPVTEEDLGVFIEKLDEIIEFLDFADLEVIIFKNRNKTTNVKKSKNR